MNAGSVSGQKNGTTTELLLFAKCPYGPLVKTRLAHDISRATDLAGTDCQRIAAHIYMYCLQRTIGIASNMSGVRLTLVVPPGDHRQWFSATFQSLPVNEYAGSVHQQMDLAAEACKQQGAAIVLLLASDTCNLSPTMIIQSIHALSSADVVVVPNSSCSCYNLIGLTGSAIPFMHHLSSARFENVILATKNACDREGLNFHWIVDTPLDDIDHLTDLQTAMRRGILPSDFLASAQEYFAFDSSIGDRLSQSVRALYERYPFPGSAYGSEKTAEALLPFDPYQLDETVERLNVAKPSRILDAGSGAGFLTLSSARHNQQSTYVGLDFSQLSLDQARAKAKNLGIDNVQFEHFDICNAILPIWGSFDCIVLIGVLHHLASPETVLGNLRGALNTGGFIRLYVYEKYARFAAHTFANACKILTANLPLSKAIAMTRDLLRVCQETSRFEQLRDERLGKLPDWQWVDTFLHPRELLFSLDSLDQLAELSGLEIVDFAQNPIDWLDEPCGRPDELAESLLSDLPELRDRYLKLPNFDQRRLTELLSPRHTFSGLNVVLQVRREGGVQ